MNIDFSHPVIAAVTGDIVGSKYEFNNIHTKDFPLFSEGCFPTDDSIMTIAVAKALTDCGDNFEDLSEKAVASMREVGRKYPGCGFGGRFYGWMFGNDPKPYGSFGNGSAMRVSPVAYAAGSIEEVKELSLAVTAVTHNHPEGIKGAEAVSVGTWMALRGASKEEIIGMLEREYYRLDFTLDEIRPTYMFDETCQGSVPQALECFREAESFEDTIRNAIALGGDCDTTAAISGALAGAYWGVPEEIAKKAWPYLDDYLKGILVKFTETFPVKEPV